MIKRIFQIAAVGFAALVVVLAINTIRYKPDAIPQAAPFEFEVDLDATVAQLSQAVKFRTISTDLTHPDFPAFLSWVQETYPVVHATMEHVVLEPHTPLYKWQGSDPEAQPVMLAAHHDVVPIEQATLDQWEFDPFSGHVDGEFVWGRGTLDDKGALVALMAVAEQLIKDGFQPKRTIYFSFGGDEEIGGNGAKAVAGYLAGQGVRLAWILDEGSFVLQDVIPGLNVPVASINLAEKGYVTMKLTATAQGGHSSMPPRTTAVGQLASALDKLQKAPVPGGLTGVSEEFFDALGRHFSIEKRIIFANRWLLGGVLEGILAGSASTDAMLRTTTAPTMLSGSPKENVLATQATATINFRLHPRDSIDDVMAHVRQAIDDEEIAITVDRATASPASPVSPSDSQGYSQIQNALRAAYGPIASVPGLTIAATDARHYAKAADAAYRINPFKITGDDLARFHGLNERLSIENLARGMSAYAALIRSQ